MSGAPQQLVLDLPHRSALGAEDFLVSDCNAAAVAMIDGWPDWPSSVVAVAGPPGSGKSHLVNVWRTKSGAERLEAPSVSENTIGRLERARALAIEHLEQGIGDERVLFHLLNLAREHKLSMLLTGRAAPGELDISLPDLRSRLRALPLAWIATPDEALLKALLVKLFADRQLKVEPHVVAHLALHMERSAEGAARIVAEVDRLALTSHRKVTRALAAEALAGLRPDEAGA
jgi:chromosomal replication initiation ATPase DnaA